MRGGGGLEKPGAAPLAPWNLPGDRIWARTGQSLGSLTLSSEIMRRAHQQGLLVTSHQQPTMPGKKENERRLQEGDSVQLSGEDMATWHMEEDLAKEHLSSTRFHEGVLLTYIG